MKQKFLQKDLLPITSNNHVELLEEGETYYQRYLELIKSAQQSIHLQTYIFKMDPFGAQVHHALIQAAQRGVKVYLLIDSVGSMDFAENFENQLIEARVIFCRFNGIHFKMFGQWGRRLHHKVLLVDHDRAIVGGINVISPSYGLKNIAPHLDFAVYLEGSALVGLTDYCQKVFRKACGQAIDYKSILKSTFSFVNQHIRLKISINDWILHRWEISKQYSKLVLLAQKNIVIINSYFFPRKKFMKHLSDAAKRGVRVRLILPKYSDWPKYILASQYLYAYFLKNGVEIYQWKKSILHGKLATVDNHTTTVGSFNLNYTSYQQNLEMNADIFSTRFTEDLNHKIEDWLVNSCEKITENDFIENATFKIKFLRFFFYLVLSLIANFSLGLTIRAPQNKTNS